MTDALVKLNGKWLFGRVKFGDIQNHCRQTCLQGVHRAISITELRAAQGASRLPRCCFWCGSLGPGHGIDVILMIELLHRLLDSAQLVLMVCSEAISN